MELKEQNKNPKKNILVITHQLSRTGAPIVLLDMIMSFGSEAFKLK